MHRGINMADSIERCSISVYSSTCCDFSPLHPSETNLTRLKDCKRGIVSHLIKNGVRSGVKGEADVFSEADLICKRVGLFTVEETFTVCPYHRDFLGIHWRPKTSCQYPNHKGTAKPYRSFNSRMCKRMISEFGILVPVGSGICRKCHGDYLNFPSSIGEVEVPIEDNREHTTDSLKNQKSSCTDAPLNETNDEAWTCRLRTRQTDTSIYEDLVPSDSQSSAVCSQSSNWSQEEEALPLQEIQLADVNAAINIISQGQISPLRSRLGTDLVDVKERTLRYYKRKAEETCTALLDAIAPHQGQRLKRIVLPSSESSDDDLFNVVGEMYHNIKDANLKCQLLSLIVHRCSYAELLTKFPEITKHQIDKARRHAFVYGPGSDVQLKASSQHRERINYAKLQHAVEFFSDPSFNEISSYTTRNLKLDSGNTLLIPDIVRTMIHSNLIKLYNAYCTSINFEPLSESTLYEVLNACSASKRKCLKGLDNIAVDGSSAFDSLSSLVDKLDEPQQWKKKNEGEAV
ncbi:uncharacterized protein [Magallana gigas]|uniref:uncharacterized protein isoform X1 n=1 Tax=Magallana gigas TaxID=29159 RepID=UPI00334061E0